jgi:hypothetical protein
MNENKFPTEIVELPFEGNSTISVGNLFSFIIFIFYNFVVVYKYMRKKEARKKCELSLIFI